MKNIVTNTVDELPNVIATNLLNLFLLCLGSLNPYERQVVGTYSSLECACLEGKPFKDIYEQLLKMFILTFKIYNLICTPPILRVPASLVVLLSYSHHLQSNPFDKNKLQLKRNPKKL